ncbi:MAG: hypothetical protein U9Q06_04125 [Nanoarchaeota archaeon]|nr:hypothetical protein [Nanoarchaeota archaeon]
MKKMPNNYNPPNIRKPRNFMNPNYPPPPNLQQPFSLPSQQPPVKKTNWVLISGIIMGVILLLIILGLILFFVLRSSDIEISSSEIARGKIVEVKQEQKVLFEIGGEEHSITVNSIGSNSVDVTIQSATFTETLDIGEEKKFDLDEDDIYDLSLKLIRINEGKAKLRVKKIEENICTENWDCGDWSVCSGEGMQTRVCIDLNDCGTEEGKPATTQNCIYIEICNENWNCTNWSICINENQTRVCTDLNDCGSEESKPVEEQDCEEPEIIDCGIVEFSISENMPLDNNEFKCIQDSFENCSRATFSSIAYHGGGVLIGRQTDLEIIEEQNNLCLTLIKEFVSWSTPKTKNYVCNFPKTSFPNNIMRGYCVDLSNFELHYEPRLKESCEEDTCCLDAIEIVKERGYTLITPLGCPEEDLNITFKEGKLNCSDTFQWCEMVG